MRVTTFDDSTLRRICEVLAATTGGLTNREIQDVLGAAGIEDPAPKSPPDSMFYVSISKRDRLFGALATRQKRDGHGAAVAQFIMTAMQPVRYTQNPSSFEERRASLNEVLAFAGVHLRQDGKLIRAAAATTIPEAQRRAGRMRRKLQERGVHSDVLRFCRAELLEQNYFHAVLEASKSVAAKIRDKSGLQSDGGTLVRDAFDLKPGRYPVLAFNSLETETQRSEHKGISSLLKGLFETFRNPVAHEPRVSWPIGEADALDILTLISLLHRRLDEAVTTSAGQK